MFAASKTAAPAGEANYIESVFSTYLYTGNDTSQTITNNIDLSTKGGMVWIKARSGTYSTGYNVVNDTVRGAQKDLYTNTTGAQSTNAQGLTSFTTTGFSVGNSTDVNGGSTNLVSWTFRKQAKFFDVVTYTGNGANRTISHNLGSVPGCIIVKRTDVAADWQVYHRSLANTEYMVLNTTAAKATGATRWNSTTPTSTEFSLGTDTTVNANGGTYVAYLFAHDAGGFGASGTDNVISCGSYVGNGSATGPVVTLGYEPQWVLVKRTTDGIEDWEIYDNMRGIVPAGADQILYPNQSSSEQSATRIQISATGFSPDGTAGSVNASGKTYIYIAIRRGPMKTPTSGTSVFGLNARTGAGANATVTGNQTDDAVLIKNRGSAVGDLFASRLTGTGYLVTSDTAAEVAAGTTILQANPWDVMDGVKVGTTSTITNASTNTFINYLFRRAPGFFDVVCYSGTGASSFTQSHNLGVSPELIIVRRRNSISTNVDDNWVTWSTGLTSASYQMFLNSTLAQATGYNITFTRSSTTFGNSASGECNRSSATYVAYLFATVAGVSKVGSYTGTGTTLQVDCGFAAGARFVLIKRTDSTGDWYVWDSARGIVAGNDPYLLLNSTAAEVTNTDYVDTYSAGFEISSTAPAAINANGGTFIFLAIA